MSKRKVSGVAVEAGKGYADAEEMVVKAQLVTKIAEIIKKEGLTQTQAAGRLGLTQPMLSNILRRRFRGISERRLMDCLTKLGRDVRRLS